MAECMPRGPIPSLIMLIGEAPGEQEERQGLPFVGASGWELEKMMREAGVELTSCFITNVVRVRPPGNDIGAFISDRKTQPHPDWTLHQGKWIAPCVREGLEKLEKEIELVQPDIIIALGNTPLWALTGNTGIQKWRGSMLHYKDRKLLPTYHPAAILRQMELRKIALHDLRRAAGQVGKAWPTADWHFRIRPSFDCALDTLAGLQETVRKAPMKLSVDIETSRNHIACLGIAWDAQNAICLPFTRFASTDGYWQEHEEAHIVHKLYKLLTHPNARVIGQNFIFDAQYIHHYWHFTPRFSRDTMLAQHVLFPGMQKSLDFICSMHNKQYVYWKEDGKKLTLDGDEDKHWTYNCEDCVRTYEADDSLQETVDAMNMRGPHDFQQSLFTPVLKMMLRGVLLDRTAQETLQKELKEEQARLQQWLTDVTGSPLNPRSSPQMCDFFYHQLALPKQYKRTEKGMVPTCDEKALEKLAYKQPLVKPIIEKIEEYRSVGVYLSNYLEDKRDADGRMRCAYNIAGTKTFRFSSSENVWGGGLNLQTIPKGDKE